MHVMTMTGRSARLKWGYYEAAELGPWSLVGHTHGGGTLTATIVSSDALRVTQAPLTFVHPNGTWEWPILTLQITNHALTAEVGS